ncbi:hypothetical protein DFH08DRAFT_976083 [Mycena albidolilacea]|uniref:Transcription factor domain-containing protein n=1 Tax=Mycena albidolilacea TaxID=1033008 RepID=A0AAD6Z3T4_9AGAR|nr:hypothetical protein DFH08DRAFT_976083 [Mycena albidolilacea]
MNSPFSSSSGGPPSPPQAASESSFLRVQEPPLIVVQMLLDHFLPHATQFGFFLHVDSFRESAVSLWADPLRPSPALLSAVYLWGAHLSSSQPPLSSEPVFLKRAKQSVSVEISEKSNALLLLHTIQAQVLLSTYLFHNNRFLEAEFHVNGAATLALGYQLHKIRSARPVPPPLLGVSALSMGEVYPAPPADALEEGERIRAFWTVACLQSTLNIVLDAAASSNFSILESSGADIDTPWPLEMYDYALGALPPAYRGQETLRTFFTEDPPPASPVPTLYAKAAVLLQRATRLSSKWSPNLDAQETAAYAVSRAWLDGRIAGFWETLPPLAAFYADSANARTLMLAYGMTAAAAIALHRAPGSVTVDPNAQTKCVSAARALLACLGDTRVPDCTTAHPIVGALCATACRALMEALQQARAFNFLVAPGTEEKEAAALARDLQHGMTTVRMYAAGSPLIRE